MAKKQYGLGKGLGAILPGTGKDLGEMRKPVGYVNKDIISTVGATPANVSDIIRINIDLIEPNPFQPRMTFDEQALEELCQSIRSLGLIQPITVRSRSEGKYQIVSGERRYRASKMAGMDMIPAYIIKTDDKGNNQLISPFLVRATDPLTSIYGAFGKFTAENNLSLNDIDRIMVTGVGATHMQKPIYSLNCLTVPEFSAAALGGLYLSGLDEAIIVSMGTGTAIIHAKKEGSKTSINYLGGTGVGGGTLLGLTKKLTGIDTIEHIEEICREGDLHNVNLLVGDISKNAKFTGVNENLTASSRVSPKSSPPEMVEPERESPGMIAAS